MSAILKLDIYLGEQMNNILWQKNLFNSRYSVEPLKDIQCQKSAFDRLAEFTDQSNKRRKKFPWLVILLFLALVTFYSYDGNAFINDNTALNNKQHSQSPSNIAEVQYLPQSQHHAFPNSYN